MKIGILSTSRIVAEALPRFAALDAFSVSCLCCRPESEQKGRALCEQYGIPALYTDYEAFLREGDFDILYNGTANHLHYPQTRQALRAGRSVILEKPFVLTAAQADELFALAEARGLWLFEAITTLHTPGFAFLRRHLPAIGPVHSVISNYSQYSSRYDAYLAGRWNTTFDPACGGGALNDLNVYNLHLIVGLFGEPDAVQYFPTRGRGGVDLDGAAVLRYPGFTACAVACKNGGSVNGCLVQGEKGCLVCRSAPGVLDDCYAVIGGERTEMPAPDRFRMDYEFLEMERIWREKDRAAHDELARRTRAVVRTLERLHNSEKDGRG